MKLSRFLVPMVLVLSLLAPAVHGRNSSPSAPDYSFEGQYTAEDWGTYRYHPFYVPEGTTTIKVKYSYSAHDGEPAVLDIGIHDPERFRGWSGSTRNEFTLSESRDLTSDAYIAGEIPEGEWRIELGVPSIDPMTALVFQLYGRNVPKRSSIVSYNVEIELSDKPVGKPWVVPPKKDVVINSRPGWYYGDLHCHSTHSDGKYPLEEVLDFAHSQDLDFIAPTEHNSISPFSYLPEMQERYDDMLILYGIEYTSYIGHANVFNYEHIMDFRATNTGYDINRVIDDIHDGGGYYSPNHPASFIGAGIPYKIEDTDWSKVDFYEVVNGKTKVFDIIPNPLNLKALRKWDGMLRDGHRITAIGGSDDHEAGKGETPITSHIGIPTTVVYAEELSMSGIFDAIDAGHVYILNEGRKSGMKIEFTAKGAGQEVMMGDFIEAEEIEYTVKVDNAGFKTLVIVENGFPLCLPILRDDFEFSFTRKPRREGYVRLEVKSGQFHKIITNPIYYDVP